MYATKPYYERNKDYYKSRANQRKRDFKQEIRDLKDRTPCADCGLNYPYYVMQFDHKDSATKTDNISAMVSAGASRRVREEIQQCDIVCANCHAARTYRRSAEESARVF